METRRASRADLDDIAALLEASSMAPLPRDTYLSNILVALDDRAVVGVITLAVASRRGIVDSVVVSPSRRGEGIEASMLRSLLTRAHELGLRELFVFTDDDPAIFEALGFARVELDEVPSEIRKQRARREESREESPETAVVMSMLLATLI